MVIGEVGADVFDRNIMRNAPVMAFGTVHGVVVAVDAQVHGGVFTAAPAVGAEYGHVDRHGAVVAGEAEQADRAWCVYFVFKGAAIVEVVAMLGGWHKTVPPLDAAKGGGVGPFLFRWNMTVDARGAVIGEGDARHCCHASAFVEAGEVVFGAEDGVGLFGGDSSK